MLHKKYTDLSRVQYIGCSKNPTPIIDFVCDVYTGPTRPGELPSFCLIWLCIAQNIFKKKYKMRAGKNSLVRWAGISHMWHRVGCSYMGYRGRSYRCTVLCHTGD